MKCEWCCHPPSEHAKWQERMRLPLLKVPTAYHCCCGEHHHHHRSHPRLHRLYQHHHHHHPIAWQQQQHLHPFFKGAAERRTAEPSKSLPRGKSWCCARGGARSLSSKWCGARATCAPMLLLQLMLRKSTDCRGGQPMRLCLRWPTEVVKWMP